MAKGKYIGLGYIKKLGLKYDHSKIDSKDLGEKGFDKLVEKGLIVVAKKAEPVKAEPVKDGPVKDGPVNDDPKKGKSK